MTHALIVRMDRLGDVLLSGPLVRAAAASCDRVTYLASPDGAPAARILPGVDRVLVDRAGWIDDPARPVTRARIDALVEGLIGLGIDVAVVLTSFHQSPLPVAMVLRMASVDRIGAISVDYPGSLLDVRHLVDDDVHEVVRALSLGQAMGYRLPPGDEGDLRVVVPPSTSTGGADVVGLPDGDYVVVHPGASVSARAWPPAKHAETVGRLADAGWQVVVTGSRSEQALTALVAGGRALDLGGRLDLPGLAQVIGGGRAIVVGNTGPAHLAAAVGTPVVSLYAPTVPASRWRPWMVRHVLLGDQSIVCAGCRARTCPMPGHPCLEGIDADAVVGAVERLASSRLPQRATGAPSLRPAASRRLPDRQPRTPALPADRPPAPSYSQLAGRPS